MGGTPPPTVTSVSPNIGNLAGGGSNRTITGANFTGATSVKFGGNEVTSMSVVNSTTIICTVAAHAAGVVDVVVTTPGGAGTGASAYEFWDPTVETPASFYDGGNYSDAGTGTWTKTVGTNLTGTAGHVPVAVNGCPDCEFTTDTPLANSVNASTWAGTGNHTLFAVITTEQIHGVSSTPYQNDGLISDSSSFLGLFLKTNAGNTQFWALMFDWDSAARQALVDITSLVTGIGIGYLIVQGKKTGGTLYVRATGTSGSGTWTSGDACGTTGGGGTLRLGGPTGTPDGVIKAVGSITSAWSDAAADKFERWARAEHP